MFGMVFFDVFRVDQKASERNANKEAARLAFREAFAQYAGHTEAIDVNTVTVDSWACNI